MTAAASPSSPRRRWLPLRFSLRVLLVAFTAFAIGFPIWYRWPYEEEVVQPSSGDPLAAVTETRVKTTWQRQWGGSRLKHGIERIVLDGKTSRITTYHQGRKHGPYQAYYVTGPLHQSGQYADGEKDGIWTIYNEDGSVKATATWQRGTLEGPATTSRRSEHQRLEYAAGRIVELNDKPVEDRLAALVIAGKIDSPAIIENLKATTGAAYVDLPLKFVAENLSQNLRVPIVVDPLHVDPDVRVTCNGQDVEFSSCLTVMAAQYGLGCDYRYGCIWITSAEDAKDWHDPTGVAEIQPPKDSQLARSWNEPATVAAVNQPLADLLAKLIQPLAIGVDTSQVSADQSASKYSVTRSLNGLPFKHVLGILLYDTRCHCELQGETLVILPPK